MEEKILNKLYKLSCKAAKKAETPVAAIILYDNKIIAAEYNKRNKLNSTISHAEILAIKKANKKLKNWRLNNCTMYVTLKPCIMCEKVIKEARLEKVYYLVDRFDNKHQYRKTKFEKINSFESNIIRKKYLEKIKEFWENIRNKK